MINFEELSTAEARKDALNCLDKSACKLCGPDKKVNIYLLRYNYPPTTLFTMCEEHYNMLVRNLDRLTSDTRLTEVVELSTQDLFTIRIL